MKIGWTWTLKRGWILFFSLIEELMIFIGICLVFNNSITWRSLIILGGIGMVIVGFLLIYFWWAPNNLFFTFVKEGTAKIIVRGDGFKKTLIQWKGHTIVDTPDDPHFGDIIDGGKEFRFGGLRFYGFWPIDDVYVYTFSWTNITLSGEIQIHPKEWMDYVLLKDDVYFAEIEAAEDKNSLPLNIGLILRIRVVNPYKAIFKIQNWLEMVINLIRVDVRDVIGSDVYENWIQKEKDLGDYIFHRIEGMVLTDGKWEKRGKNKIEEFELSYGVKIVSLGVKNIDPTPIESLSGIRAVTIKKYLAEQEKKRIKIEASAEAEKVKILAEAEKMRLEKVWSMIQNFGDLGQVIRGLEALEKSTEKGAKWVIPFGGIRDFLTAIFPHRDVNSLQIEEIKKIREELERLK